MRFASARIKQVSTSCRRLLPPYTPKICAFGILVIEPLQRRLTSTDVFIHNEITNSVLIGLAMPGKGKRLRYDYVKGRLLFHFIPRRFLLYLPARNKELPSRALPSPDLPATSCGTSPRASHQHPYPHLLPVLLLFPSSFASWPLILLS